MINCGILCGGQSYWNPYINWIKKDSIDSNYTLCGIWNPPSDVGLLEEKPSKLFEISDVILSFGFDKIISESDILKVPLGIINFHNSYRLKHRGSNCSSYPILNQDEKHGSSMHFINKKLDDGAIIGSDFFEIECSDTAEDIFYKAHDLGLSLLKKNFKKIINGSYLKPIPPDKESIMHRKKDLIHELKFKELDDEKKFFRKVRALTFKGKPLPYIKMGNQKIEFKFSKI